MSFKNEKIAEFLFIVVDDTLKQIFIGEDVETIYNFLEKKFHLRRVEIAENPEIFSTGLRRLMGKGALSIERAILKGLYSKLNLRFEEKKGYKFSDYLEIVIGLQSPVEGI